MPNRSPLAVLFVVMAACSSSPRSSNAEPGAAPAATPDSPPLACTLTPEELSNRRDQLLPGLVGRAEEVTDLENGLRLRFQSTEGLITELARVVEAERCCCSFLRFQLTAEPESGAVTFDVTGPAGTRELLRSLSKPGDAVTKPPEARTR